MSGRSSSRQLQAIRALLILLAAFLLPKATHADMQLVVRGELSGHLRDHVRLRIFGQIRPEDAKQALTLIRKAQEQSDKGLASGQPMLWVSLDSRGGNILAAMEIGRLLRTASAHVIVDQDAECTSACIFLLASGVDRWVLDGARLGLHRPFFEQGLFARLSVQDAKKLYSELIERCRRYLDQMGMSDDLFRRMLRIPSQKVEYIDRNLAENIGLIGEDPAFAEWLRAKDVERLGEDQLKRRDRIVDCLNAGILYETCLKRFGPWPK